MGFFFFVQCTSEDFDHGTECLLLAMKYVGVHGIILDGSPDLWKVWALPEYYMLDHSNLNQRFYSCLHDKHQLMMSLSRDNLNSLESDIASICTQVYCIQMSSFV